MACQGLVPGFGSALRYDERARCEPALTGRRPQPTAAAAVTRRPCGDPIKKAPSARGAARRQLRKHGVAIYAHSWGANELWSPGLVAIEYRTLQQ